MHLIGRFVAALFISASLVACSAKDTSEPPKPLSKLESASVEFERDWAKHIGDGARRRHLQLAPAANSSRVIAADHQGTVMSMSIKNGWVKWKQDIGQKISSGPVLFGDRIFLGGHNGDLLALDLATGELVWRASLSSEVLALPITNGKTVVARSVDSRLFAFDYKTGEKLWTYEETMPALTLRGVGKPVFAAGLVVAGFDNGRIVALSERDGAPVWNLQLASPRGRSDLERLVDVDADLVVIGGDLYATAYNGRLVSLAAESGQILWRRDVSGFTGLANDDDNLYVVTSKSKVMSISRKSGDTNWVQDMLYQRQLTKPTVVSQHLVVGDFEGYVHALSLDAGEVVGREKIDRRGIHAPIALSENKIFALGRGGLLASMKLKQ